MEPCVTFFGWVRINPPPRPPPRCLATQWFEITAISCFSRSSDWLILLVWADLAGTGCFRVASLICPVAGRVIGLGVCVGELIYLAVGQMSFGVLTPILSFIQQANLGHFSLWWNSFQQERASSEAFQTSAYVTSLDAPLANGSFRAKLRFKEVEKQITPVDEKSGKVT